jgi:hypothetical protein
MRNLKAMKFAKLFCLLTLFAPQLNAGTQYDIVRQANKVANEIDSANPDIVFGCAEFQVEIMGNGFSVTTSIEPNCLTGYALKHYLKPQVIRVSIPLSKGYSIYSGDCGESTVGLLFQLGKSSTKRIYIFRC